MVIRPADAADSDAIARIHVDSWRTAYRGLVPDRILDGLDVSRRANFWRNELSAAAWPVFVADDGGAILGFCSSGPARDADLDARVAAEIMAIYLDPLSRRRGHGRLLCEKAMGEATRRGFLAMVLWVLEANTPARAFYEALGFSADGLGKVEPSLALREVRYVRKLQGV